jgi:hypothetical protein
MKLFRCILACASMAVAGMAVDLRRATTPDEFAAAGLARLSPEELQALGKLVDRLQSSAPPAEPAGGAAAGKSPSWLSALLTLERAGEAKGGHEVLQTRLAGSLKSFSGRRNFTLQNGQQWQMIEPDSYAGPAYENPEVFIEPGMLGYFWLRIPEGALRVKVKPLKLQ